MAVTTLWCSHVTKRRVSIPSAHVVIAFCWVSFRPPALWNHGTLTCVQLPWEWRAGAQAVSQKSALDLFTLCCQRGQSVVHESLPCVVKAVRVLSTKVYLVL